MSEQRFSIDVTRLWSDPAVYAEGIDAIMQAIAEGVDPEAIKAGIEKLVEVAFQNGTVAAAQEITSQAKDLGLPFEFSHPPDV